MEFIYVVLPLVVYVCVCVRWLTKCMATVWALSWMICLCTVTSTT